MSLTQCQTSRRHFCIYMEFLLLPTPGPDCRTTLPLHLPPPIRHHSPGLGKLTCLNNIKTILFLIISMISYRMVFYIFIHKTRQILAIQFRHLLDSVKCKNLHQLLYSTASCALLSLRL